MIGIFFSYRMTTTNNRAGNLGLLNFYTNIMCLAWRIFASCLQLNCIICSTARNDLVFHKNTRLYRRFKG